MRCSSCGFPLSPFSTATNCPRCGTLTNTSQKAASTPAQPQYQQVNWGTEGEVEPGAQTPPPNYQWAQNVQGLPTNSPPLQSGQMWLPGQVSQSEYLAGPPPQCTPRPASRNTKLGFVAAGLCILAGGLILIFVYFLASGLSGNNSSNAATTNSSPIAISTTTTAPTATAIPSTTISVYPGQQYINHAQMTAAVDTNSMQPTQPTTTFKTGQKIYVSFQLHPPGHNGAFCVIWYLNSKQIANFSLPVSATSTNSYAYSIYGGTGAAYVELYWASSIQCTDQVLAQHVDFTVTN